ncbi:helix-turn-helix domain-containing protein [Olivibacter sp. XZL3]|uniref:helix-turn-helix domain-containing protein n=1 Tax=Olivibacter sp. XZL3 TaxID=1735116 RepID=UPI0010661B2C|nr:helix-turn-helix transcriptional regulator [Olivibacter sp. XZL3]
MANQYRDEPYLKKVGQRLIQIRIQNNWSQEKLAEITGLDTRQIGRIERAETNSTISIIKKIAKTTGLKMSDILED